MTTIRIEIEPQYAVRLITFAKEQMPALLCNRTGTPDVYEFSSPDPHDIYKLGIINGAFLKDKTLKSK